MTSPDALIAETTDRIFRELADPQVVNAARDDAWKSGLWTALEEVGLTRAWVPDDRGGAGAELIDGFEILRIAGCHAVAVPLAETLLAGWLLAKAGLDVPDGPLTVALGDGPELDCDALKGTARGIPFAADAGHIALVAAGAAGPQVVLVHAADATIADGPGIAGDGLAAVSFDGVRPVAAAPLPNALGAQDLMLMGAAVRAQQMAGALQAVLAMSTAYAKERQAFGRQIGKFQAVQQNLARLAGETAAAVAAAGSAADAIQNAEAFDEAVFLEVAAAKIRAGEAAGEGAAIAHQAHGAMGFTEEHVLHRYTRRLMAWRDDFGSEAEWAVGLGAMVAAAGADALWPMVAAR
ncbi:MAG: acyl-CoA dehydrogenase family protein [Rhodospirillaceae bacterium]